MRGVTLIELMVAIVIVSIMMMGIAGTNNSLQHMNKVGAASGALFIRTQAIVDKITQDAVYSTGSGNDMGVCLNNTATDANYFCFRNTAANIWVCYTRLDSTSRVSLYRCTRAITASCLTGADPLSCSSCGQSACATSDELIGTMASDVFAGAWPSFGPTGFRMPVINRDNPAAAKSTDNPEVVMSVVSYPEAHSF